MSLEDSPTDKDRASPAEYEVRGSAPLIGTQSPGVARIEALSKHITTGNRIAIFLGVFLIAYAYGLVSQFSLYCVRRYSANLILGWHTALCVPTNRNIGLREPFVTLDYQRCESCSCCCRSGMEFFHFLLG